MTRTNTVVMLLGVAACVAVGIEYWWLFIPARPEALKSIDRADTIEFSEVSRGLGWDRSTGTRYDLRRTATGWMATARSSAVIGPDRICESQQSEAISAPAVAPFLDRLSAVPLRKGPYVPGVTPTDVLAGARITVRVGGQELAFHSESFAGDRDHSPWASTIGTVVYVIPSRAPDHALEILEPYLAKFASVRAALADSCMPLPLPALDSPRYGFEYNLSGAARVVPTLGWKAVDGAIAYHLRVSTDRRFADSREDAKTRFNDLRVDLKTESLSIDMPDLKEGTYFWDVAAVNKDGRDGYASTSLFHIIGRAQPKRR